MQNPAMAMKSAAPAGAAAGSSNPLHSAIMNVFNSADKDFGVEEVRLCVPYLQVVVDFLPPSNLQ